MASCKGFVIYLSALFGLLACFRMIQGQELSGTWYELGDLTSCKRVPNEPPCNITRAKFVSDYSSRQYYKLMEKIYRLVRDIARLDSRPQCIHAYENFLCAQYFPECEKGQDPRYPNLEISRRIKFTPTISAKCSKVIASCNSFVAAKFVGDKYFLCDFVEKYPPDGWELNRCVKYDEESRCRPSQELVSMYSITTTVHHQGAFRVNHTPDIEQVGFTSAPIRPKKKFLNTFLRRAAGMYVYSEILRNRSNKKY